MQIRKNTKAFKTIVEIVTACQNRADREKLIRLYITRAGHSIHERMNVEGIQAEAALFYEMNYQTVLNNLKSSHHQLQSSEDVPGIYFFHGLNKSWDESPFEFDEAVLTEYKNLPELPATRKKEKVVKTEIPVSKHNDDSVKQPKMTKRTGVKNPTPAPEVDEEQPPRYKLRHEITFTDLDKLTFRQARVSKADVLDYYEKVSDHILPYLKGRSIENLDTLVADNRNRVPRWLKWDERQGAVCNTKEQLLLYVELGILEFKPSLSMVKSLESPDHLIIGLDGREADHTKTIELALTAKDVFEGLKLTAGVKTDGEAGFHFYITLDGKNSFHESIDLAEFICKLIKLKAPDQVNLKGGLDEHVYGRVIIDYSINHKDRHVIAPYSLLDNDSPVVAVPVTWGEVNESLRLSDFSMNAILSRLKESGDVLDTAMKKKVNAGEVLDRLEQLYSFLL